MKITVDTTSLSRELFKLQGIANAKATLPIVQFALLTATADGQLLLQATDLDVSLSTRIECQTTTPGQIALKAREFYDVVKNLKTETVTINSEENHWANLRSGTVRARLVGADPAEYPRIASAANLQTVSLRTTALQRMIDRTFFSVSTDEARPNLTGALFQASNRGRLLMVSTDGHRLSKAETTPAFTFDDAPRSLQTGVIVPRKGLEQLRRTLDVTEGTTLFGFEGSTIVFLYGNTTLSIRLIDGTFPNFNQVIPEEKVERRASVNRKEFLDRVKFVSLFSSSKTHNLRLQFEEDTCTISAQDPDRGECEEKVQITYSGSLVRAGFNNKYLTDVLAVIQGDTVTIEMVDALSPTILRETEGDDGDDALFIVMPMRL